MAILSSCYLDTYQHDHGHDATGTFEYEAGAIATEECHGYLDWTQSRVIVHATVEFFLITLLVQAPL